MWISFSDEKGNSKCSITVQLRLSAAMLHAVLMQLLIRGHVNLVSHSLSLNDWSYKKPADPAATLNWQAVS